MTQFSLAARLGVSLFTIQQLEGGHQLPRVTTLLGLVRELGPFELDEGKKTIKLYVKGNARE